MQTTITKPDAAAQPGPNRSFPRWMNLPPEKFDAKRALRGAVRMGDEELVRIIIERHLPLEDLVPHLKQAGLNRSLLDAVDKNDPHAVRMALGEGADPRTADWAHNTRFGNGGWFSALRSALSDAYSGGDRTKEVRARGREIVELLMERGARGATFEELKLYRDYHYGRDC